MWLVLRCGGAACGYYHKREALGLAVWPRGDLGRLELPDLGEELLDVVRRYVEVEVADAQSRASGQNEDGLLASFGDWHHVRERLVEARNANGDCI